MVIDPKQNTPENGYGSVTGDGMKARLLSIWAKFYRISHFPTYEEALSEYKAGQSTRYASLMIFSSIE